MANHAKQETGKLKYVVIFILIVILVVGGVYFFMNNKNETEETASNLLDKTTKELSIDVFKNELQKNELTISEETQKSAALIGAEEGYGYIINGNPIEIYKFDEKSTDDLTKSNIKSAKNDEKVTMPTFNNMTLKAKYNQGLCLINYENHPDKDKILEIFNNL